MKSTDMKTIEQHICNDANRYKIKIAQIKDIYAGLVKI